MDVFCKVLGTFSKYLRNRKNILCLLFLFANFSHAANFSAHVHGSAELMIAMEGQRIEVQLLSPAANIFGFEHSPSTEEEWQQVKRAEEILNNSKNLLEFKNAQCASLSEKVDLPFSNDVHQKSSSDSHEEHQHHEAHADVIASYLFECDGEMPIEIHALILNQFPEVETLEVQWITEAGQGSQEIRADQSRITLK